MIAALANGITLLVVAFGIFREAWNRFQEPEPVIAGPMLVVAVIGLAVNLIVALVLSDHDHGDLNVRSAFLHVLGDALSSVGVIVAGSRDPVDRLDMGRPARQHVDRRHHLARLRCGLLRETLHILVEGAPDGVSAGQIGQALRGCPGVGEIHDLHIWTVSPGYVSLSAHVVLADSSFADAQGVQERLRVADGRTIQHRTFDDSARV